MPGGREIFHFQDNRTSSFAVRGYESMNGEEQFDELRQRALAWAREQEAQILKFGVPLRPAQLEDAARVGVQDPARVRILIVDRISIPDDDPLAEAARRAQIITEASRGVTLGHGILIRGDSWHDRELLVHALVHVAQCERVGGLDRFVAEYLQDRKESPDFSLGRFEDEAREKARQICSGQGAEG